MGEKLESKNQISFEAVVHSLDDIYNNLQYDFILREYVNLDKIMKVHPSPYLESIQMQMASAVSHQMLSQQQQQG